MRLYLVAATNLRKDGYRKFLGDRSLEWKESKKAKSGQRLIELAGRVCYLSFGQRRPLKRQSPKSNTEYVRHLIEQKHESVLEHSSYSILADHISRGLSHQLVRHRIGFAFSQLSQQYHDESLATFVAPWGLRANDGVAKQWRRAMRTSKNAYKSIATALEKSTYASSLSKKERARAVRSLARTVLPAATSTTLMITGNVRAWRHLLDVRGAISGDFEMRNFCVQAISLLVAEAPDLFFDFEVKVDSFGKYVTKTS